MGGSNATPSVGESVQLKVDVLVGGANTSYAARDATKTIPIVSVAAGDLVGVGLVTSLARPGGNIPHVLWGKYFRDAGTCRWLRRQDSQGRPARRPPGRGSHEVRAGPSPPDRVGPRPDRHAV